jgi:predicted membrane metal-binding protein
LVELRFLNPHCGFSLRPRYFCHSKPSHTPIARPNSMQWLAAFCLFLLVLQPIDLEPIILPVIRPVNRLCLQGAPASIYRPWYQAIVCGENLPPSMEKSWFQQSGLIHVIVVSGSHLVFLDEILQLVLGAGRISGWVRWLALILFSLASNLQPPVTRALLQRGCAWFFRRSNRRFTSLHLQLISGLLTVALFPGWWLSLSFLMSWLCALALSVPMPSKNPLWRAAAIYLLLIPAMASIQFPHPASILFNVVFAPILGLILFPMSLLGFSHPLLAHLCDLGWQTLFWIFSRIPMPDNRAGLVFSSLWLILYMAGAQAAGFYCLIRSRRKLWNVYSSSY